MPWWIKKEREEQLLQGEKNRIKKTGKGLSYWPSKLFFFFSAIFIVFHFLVPPWGLPLYPKRPKKWKIYCKTFHLPPWGAFFHKKCLSYWHLKLSKICDGGLTNGGQTSSFIFWIKHYKKCIKIFEPLLTQIRNLLVLHIFVYLILLKVLKHVLSLGPIWGPSFL